MKTLLKKEEPGVQEPATYGEKAESEKETVLLKKNLLAVSCI